MKQPEMLEEPIVREVSALCAEEQLLLGCARVELDETARAHVRAVAAGRLDWMYLVAAATRHAVAPLVHHGLETAFEGQAADVVPAAALDELAWLGSAAGERSEHVFDQVEAIAARFQADGIETIGLKDITLAHRVYPRPALRPVGDVDLLVRRDDYARAARCLQELGFHPTVDGDGRFGEQYAVGRHLRRARDELWIDLQWNIAQREWDLHGDGVFTYDVERMWRNARPLEGHGFLSPSPEDMLFHLCLHADGHRFGELILLCDIAEVLRTQAATLDWDDLVDLARRHDARSPVYYTLTLTQRLLGVAAPGDVLRQLEPTHFQGALLGPLFANVGPLHESLDHIERAARPRKSGLAGFERVVRRQAVRTMRLAAELDAIASGFTDRGGQLIVVAATPSARVFPDEAIAPFGEIEAAVLAGDAELADETLGSCGFEPAHDGNGLEKHCSIAPRDPVLAGEELALTLRSSLRTELDEPTATPARSKRELAASTIRAHLRRGSAGVAEPEARLTVRALPPEELIAWCVLRAAVARDRLFGLCLPLRPLEQLHESADLGRVAELVRRHGETPEAIECLARLGTVLAGDARSALVRTALTPPTAAGARLFEWARYGESALHRDPDLRDPFFFLLALVSADTLRERAGYVLRSLARAPSDDASLSRLLFRACRGALRARRGARPAAPEPIFWIDNSAR